MEIDHLPQWISWSYKKILNFSWFYYYKQAMTYCLLHSYLFPILYIESSYKWFSPKITIFIIIVLILILPQREQFLFVENSPVLVFDMLELEYTTGMDLKPSIGTLFGKIIHFNYPLKLCNNFISYRESIYFSK